MKPETLDALDKFDLEDNQNPPPTPEGTIVRLGNGTRRQCYLFDSLTEGAVFWGEARSMEAGLVRSRRPVNQCRTWRGKYVWVQI